MRRIRMFVAPWNYQWPGRAKVTCFSEVGIILIPPQLNEAADAAIAAGVATEFETAAPKRATTRRRSARPAVDATDPGQPAGMDRADMAAADSAGRVDAVDDAG